MDNLNTHFLFMQTGYFIVYSDSYDNVVVLTDGVMQILSPFYTKNEIPNSVYLH